MSFTETPAAAFTAGVSTISAATANTWKANIADSLDTVNGGAYVNVSTIDWSAGSAGWRFYAAVAIKSTGTLTLDAGATVTINADPSLFGTMRVGVGGAGGGVRWYATSTLQVDDTVVMTLKGDATWTAESTQVHASGSTDTYPAGSFLTVNTALFSLGAGAVFTCNGVLGNVAQVVFGQYSTVTCQSGSGFTCNSGSLFTLASGSVVTATIGGGGAVGSLTFGADATLTVPTTCTTSLSLGADGTFVVTAGAAVTMSVGGGGTPGTLTINADGTLTTTASSDFNNGGTTTRTGPEILSGSSAYTALRVTDGPDAATANIDGRAQDVLEVDTLTLASVYTLTSLAASETCRFKIRVATTTALDIVRAGPVTLASFALGVGDARTVELYWNGTVWRVLELSAVFANL